MKKEELTKINVRIVNMRSANFTQIREGLEKQKQKHNFLKLSFCDEEEKVHISPKAEWTVKSLMRVYRKLEPQAAKFCQPHVICPIYSAYRKLKSQSTDIYLFITDYKVKKRNYGGCIDNKEMYFYLSLYGITDYLRDENIRLSNFAQIAIYRDVLRHLCGERIAHNETKDCIFDTNSAERLPLITKSCAEPTICCECRDTIKKLLEKNEKPIA